MKRVTRITLTQSLRVAEMLNPAWVLQKARRLGGTVEPPAPSESDDDAGVATPHPSTPSPPKTPPAQSKPTKRTRAPPTADSSEWFIALSLGVRRKFMCAEILEALHGLPVIKISGQSFFASAPLLELLQDFPSEFDTTWGKFPTYKSRLHTIFNGLSECEFDTREFDLLTDPDLAEWYSVKMTEFLIRKYGSATFLLDFLAYKRDIDPSSMPFIDASGDMRSPERKSAKKSPPTLNNDSSKKKKKAKPKKSTTTATNNQLSQLNSISSLTHPLPDNAVTESALGGQITPSASRLTEIITVDETSTISTLKHSFLALINDPVGSIVLITTLLSHPDVDRLLQPYRDRLHARALPLKRLFQIILFGRHHFSSNDKIHFSKMSSLFSKIYSGSDRNEQFFPMVGRNDALQSFPAGYGGNIAFPPPHFSAVLAGPGAIPVAVAKTVTQKSGKCVSVVQLELKPALDTYFAVEARRALVCSGVGGELKFTTNFDHAALTTSFRTDGGLGATHFSISFCNAGALNHGWKGWVTLCLASTKDTHETYKMMNIDKIIEDLQGITLTLSVDGGDPKSYKLKHYIHTLDFPALQSAAGAAGFGSSAGKSDVIQSTAPNGIFGVTSNSIMPLFHVPANLTSKILNDMGEDDLKRAGYTCSPSRSLVLNDATHGPMHALARMFNQLNGSLFDLLSQMGGKAAITKLEKALNKEVGEGGVGLCFRMVQDKFTNKYKICQQGENSSFAFTRRRSETIRRFSLSDRASELTLTTITNGGCNINVIVATNHRCRRLHRLPSDAAFHRILPDGAPCLPDRARKESGHAC